MEVKVLQDAARKMRKRDEKRAAKLELDGKACRRLGELQEWDQAGVLDWAGVGSAPELR